MLAAVRGGIQISLFRTNGTFRMPVTGVAICMLAPLLTETIFSLASSRKKYARKTCHQHLSFLASIKTPIFQNLLRGFIFSFY